MRFGEKLFCVMWTLSRGLTTDKSPVPTGAQNNQEYKEMTNYWAEQLASTNLNDQGAQWQQQSECIAVKFVFICSIWDSHTHAQIQLEQRLWEEKTTWTHMHAET